MTTTSEKENRRNVMITFISASTHYEVITYDFIAHLRFEFPTEEIRNAMLKYAQELGIGCFSETRTAYKTHYLINIKDEDIAF